MVAHRVASLALVVLAAAVASADPPAATREGGSEPQARAMSEIWADVVAQRNRIVAAAEGEIEEPDLAEMESAVLRLFVLMDEIRESVDRFEDPHPIRIERAVRFVISRARDLEHASRLRLPGPVPRILPHLDEQLYVLQDRFPADALVDKLPPR